MLSVLNPVRVRAMVCAHYTCTLANIAGTMVKCVMFPNP